MRFFDHWVLDNYFKNAVFWLTVMWFAVKNVIQKKAFFWPPESLHPVKKENQIFLI
jgi:hypothetical protein